MSEWKHRIRTSKLHHQFLPPTECHLLSFTTHNYPILTAKLLKFVYVLHDMLPRLVHLLQVLLFWLVYWILLQILLFWLSAFSSATIYFSCYYLMEVLITEYATDIQSLHYIYPLIAFHLLILEGLPSKRSCSKTMRFLFEQQFCWLFTFGAEYIQNDTSLTYVLFTVSSVCHGAKHHQFPLQL